MRVVGTGIKTNIAACYFNMIYFDMVSIINCKRTTAHLKSIRNAGSTGSG